MNDTERDHIRLQLCEIMSELQTVEGELENLAGDYQDQFDMTSVYEARKVVSQARERVHAARLQFEEWNDEEEA